MVSAGNAPMIIPKTYHPDEEQFIAGGAILPVSDYLDLMPNFQDKVKKWNLDADLDQMRQADGKFYLLPGLHEDVWVDYSIAVRTDILDKLKLSPPQTWDDLHNVLTAMKAAYPDRYPFSDRWSTPPNPGANCLIQTLGQAYGIGAGWYYEHATWDATADKFVYTGATDQYKQVLQYLNKLVSEKLLDPESFTQTDDNARQKFASGKSFVISSNAQSVIDYRKDIAKIPGATVIKIPVPTGPMGATKMGIRTGERHDDLHEGQGQQELRGDDAVHRLAVVFRRRPAVRQVGHPGHHLHRQPGGRHVQARAGRRLGRPQPDGDQEPASRLRLLQRRVRLRRQHEAPLLAVHRRGEEVPERS